MLILLRSIVIGYLCFAGTAYAAKPPEIAKYIQASAPHGEATLRKLFLTVYDAQLWTDKQPWSLQQTYALTLRYHMGFTAEELIDRTIEEMQRLGAKSDAVDGYRATLQKVMPGVKDGDRVTAISLNGKSTLLFYNGTRSGQVDDAAFTKLFFSIWLAKNSSEPAMQRALTVSASAE